MIWNYKHTWVLDSSHSLGGIQIGFSVHILPFSYVIALANIFISSQIERKIEHEHLNPTKYRASAKYNDIQVNVHMPCGAAMR